MTKIKKEELKKEIKEWKDEGDVLRNDLKKLCPDKFIADYFFDPLFSIAHLSELPMTEVISYRKSGRKFLKSLWKRKND